MLIKALFEGKVFTYFKGVGVLGTGLSLRWSGPTSTHEGKEKNPKTDQQKKENSFDF